MSGYKRFFLGFSIFFTLALSVFLLWVSTSHTTPILMYHIVSPTEELSSNIIRPDTFKYQMDFIKKRGFRVLSLDDYIDMHNRDRKISRWNIVLTFDDGHESLYEYAFPVLKKYKFPATIYMPSNKIGQKGYLSTTQIWEMEKSGLITFGSHTHNDEYLPDLPEEEQLREITRSKEKLESLLEGDILHFSYPFGGFTENIKGMLKDAGYVSAVTTNRGYDRYNEDTYELKRVSMREKDSRWDYLLAKLSGYYNLFRRAKSPY